MKSLIPWPLKYLVAAFSVLLATDPFSFAGNVPKIVLENREEILESLNTWLAEADSPLAGRVNLFIDSHEGNTLRVRIIPQNPRLGPVLDGYLRWQPNTDNGGKTPSPGELGGHWKVLALEEFYTPQVYEDLEIPQSLRDPVRIPDFLPANPAVVEELRQILGDALQIRLSEPVQTAFQDVVMQQEGISTRFTFQMQGPVIPEPTAAFEMVRRDLVKHGWQPIPHYSSTGDRGVIGAFSRGAVRMYLRIGWIPAPRAAGEPVWQAQDYVPLDQRVYHLIADVVAREKSGKSLIMPKNSY